MSVWTDEMKSAAMKDAQKVCDLDAEVKRLREALAAIKAIVVGEKHPNWTDQHATTVSRGRIADICDLS